MEPQSTHNNSMDSIIKRILEDVDRNSKQVNTLIEKTNLIGEFSISRTPLPLPFTSLERDSGMLFPPETDSIIAGYLNNHSDISNWSKYQRDLGKAVDDKILFNRLTKPISFDHDFESFIASGNEQINRIKALSLMEFNMESISQEIIHAAAARE